MMAPLARPQGMRVVGLLAVPSGAAAQLQPRRMGGNLVIPSRGARLPCGRREFHPILAAGALAKLLMVKKVGFWGAYGATKVYGWEKVARKLLKFNLLHTPKPAQKAVQAALVAAIRTPSQAYSLLQDTHVYRFVGKVASDGASHVPNWVQSIAASIAGKTHVWKALKELEAESQKQASKKLKQQAVVSEAEKSKLQEELTKMTLEKAAAEARLAELLAAMEEQSSKR